MYKGGKWPTEAACIAGPDYSTTSPILEYEYSHFTEVEKLYGLCSKESFDILGEICLLLL